MITNALLSISLVVLITVISFYISRRYKFLPLPLLLFLFGVLAQNTYPQLLEPIKLNDHIVLYFYLPILLAESAISFRFSEFKLITIQSFIFATLGLVLSGFIIALPLTWIFSIDLNEALIFGFVISSTDPIAVLSVFKSLGIPKKLQLLVDAESFLNDATSIVGLKIMLAISAVSLNSGVLDSGKIFDLGFNFFYLIFGGALLGLVLGWIISEIITLIKELPYAEIVLSIILPLLTFALSEEIFHVSGIIAVLVAGLILGNYGRHKISPETFELFKFTWEQIGFITMSVVFVLIGNEVTLNRLFNYWFEISVAVLLVMVSRSVVVYLIGGFINLTNLKFINIPLNWLHILNLGGIRGILPFILIFSIQEQLKNYDVFISMVLGSVFFTLVFNTIYIVFLIKYLKINQLSVAESLENLILKLLLFRSFKLKTKQLLDEKEIIKDTYDKRLITVKSQIEDIQKELKLKITQLTEVEAQRVIDSFLKKYFLNIEREVYNKLYEHKVIDVFLMEKLNRSVEKQIVSIDCGIEQFSKKRISFEAKVEKIKEFTISSTYLLHLFGKKDVNSEVCDLYLYYKCRVIGNQEVLKEIENGFSILNGLVKELSLNSIKLKYQKLLEENEERLSLVKEEYSSVVENIEDQICSAEFSTMREHLIELFSRQDRASESVIRSI